MQTDLLFYFQGQAHWKQSYNQNMTISTRSFQLLIHFATKLGLIVDYDKPECFMEKFDCCVQGQGHKFQNVRECLSR